MSTLRRVQGSVWMIYLQITTFIYSHYYNCEGSRCCTLGISRLSRSCLRSPADLSVL